MILDWQVVVVAIPTILLRIYILLAKPEGEEFDSGRLLGVPGKPYPMVPRSMSAGRQANFEGTQ